MGRWAYATALLILPVLTLLLTPATDHHILAIAGLLAVAIVVAVTVRPAPLAPAVAACGPPASARRLRGSFLPQSNPDSPGRPRPRAPGHLLG